MKDDDLMLDYHVEMAYMTKAAAGKLRFVNPRKVRSLQVQSLTNALLKGEHFDSCLVISQKSGYSLNVVDGQHRVLAMRNYFKKNPDSRIQVALVIYRKLTANQEREVYRKWNIPIKQTTDDFINSYREDIPIFDLLINEIPCTIYGGPKAMKIKDLINAHIGAKEKPFRGGEGRTSYDFVLYMQKLTDGDVARMKYIFKLLHNIFNPTGVKDFHKLSPFKNVVYRALYYLVENNVDGLGESYVKRRMNTVLANRTIVDQYRRFYGRRASIDAYMAFKNLLNDTKSDKKFI